MRARVVRLVDRIDRVWRLVFLEYAFGTMFGPTPVHGWSAIIALPDLSIAMRSRLVASFGSKTDSARCRMFAGATSTNSTTATGTSASSFQLAGT